MAKIMVSAQHIQDLFNDYWAGELLEDDCVLLEQLILQNHRLLEKWDLEAQVEELPDLLWGDAMDRVALTDRKRASEPPQCPAQQVLFERRAAGGT